MAMSFARRSIESQPRDLSDGLLLCRDLPLAPIVAMLYPTQTQCPVLFRGATCRLAWTMIYGRPAGTHLDQWGNLPDHPQVSLLYLEPLKECVNNLERQSRVLAKYSID